jgi:hypothetical protein
MFAPFMPYLFFNSPVGIAHFSPAVQFVIIKFAFVHIAVQEGNFPPALRFAVNKIAFVNKTAVRIFAFTFAVGYAVLGFAFVTG